MRELVDIKVNADMRARFDALPDKGGSPLRRKWKPEEDAMLLAYWPIKQHGAVAKALGVDKATALARYRELTA